MRPGISLPLIAAQTVAPKVSDDWLAPLWPDETTSLTAGEQFEIRWTPNITRWFPGYAPAADINNVTLWITGAFQAQYAHVVSPYLNLTRQQGTRWTVNLPDSELQATDIWTFRFLAANETRFSGQNGQQVSSPQLRIRANTTTSLPPARTGPPSSTSSPAVPSLTPTPIPSSSGGLSAGATAGIAVGTALLALLLAAIAFFLFRRRRQRKLHATPPPAPEMSAYHDNATTYSPGHAHNLSDGSSGYFPGFGPNSHAQHSGTFSGASTVSSFPGSQGLPAYAQHPPMPMTPQSNVFTPGSDASGHLSQGAPGGQGYYAPTPEKGPGEVPATPVVGKESEVSGEREVGELTGTEVERSELEAPKGGLWRDEGAGARRD